MPGFNGLVFDEHRNTPSVDTSHIRKKCRVPTMCARLALGLMSGMQGLKYDNSLFALPLTKKWTPKKDNFEQLDGIWGHKQCTKNSFRPKQAYVTSSVAASTSP